MSYMRKMALVPVDSLKIKQHATAEKPKPYARAVNTQGEHMKQLMYDTKLDPATLAALLQQATRKYLHFQRSRPTDYPAAASAALQRALTPASTPTTSKHTTPYSSKLTSTVTSDSEEEGVFLPTPEATPRRRESDSDDDLDLGNNRRRRPAIVRSQAATSGRVVPGRPSTAESLRRSAMRAWQPYS
jgi:hypothetical protein